MTRLLPFRADDGIFDPGFIEDRRKGLEAFVNKELVLIQIRDSSSDWLTNPINLNKKRWLVIHWLRMRNLFIFFFKKLQLTETIRLAKFEPPNLSSTFYSEAAFIILLRIMSYHNDSLSLMTSFSLSNM